MFLDYLAMVMNFTIYEQQDTPHGVRPPHVVGVRRQHRPRQRLGRTCGAWLRVRPAPGNCPAHSPSPFSCSRYDSPPRTGSALQVFNVGFSPSLLVRSSRPVVFLLSCPVVFQCSQPISLIKEARNSQNYPRVWAIL